MIKLLKKYASAGVLEYLLGIAVLVAIFMYVQLNMSAELHDPDVWLHIKTGEYILQHKAVPQVDVFSAALSGKAWIDHSWLVQVIYYSIFRFLGADNLIFFSAALIVISFFILFFCAYRRKKDLTLCVAMLFLAALASKIRFNIRPENFSILFFSLFLFVLSRWKDTRRIHLLALIQVFWVNCHGFFIAGPFLVLVFYLAERIKPYGTRSRDTCKNLLITFFLVCAANFINPYGYKGALYPLWVIASSGGKSNVVYGYIQELLPTWRYFRILGAYYVLAILSVIVFFLNFRRINIAYFILWLASLSASLCINRNVLFFNFIAFLAITDGIINGEAGKLKAINKTNGKIISLSKFAILSAIIAYLSIQNFSMLNNRYYVFDEARSKSTLLGIDTKRFPDKAADFILQNHLKGNIFNLFNYGSYLIYRLSPQNKVFIDGRTELYGEEFFKNYQRTLASNKTSLEDALNKYSINIAVLYGHGLDIGGLGKYFIGNPQWQLVYFSADTLIFVKDNPENIEVIDKCKVELAKWKVPKADPEKMGMKNVFPEPYLKRAWMFYELGFKDLAVAEAKEALRILPSASEAYNILGMVYTDKKLNKRAYENLRLARIYGPATRETLTSLGDFYMSTERFSDAVKIYKNLVRLNPYLPEAYYLLSRGYSRTGQKKEAVKCMKKAAALNPYSEKYATDLKDLLAKIKK